MPKLSDIAFLSSTVADAERLLAGDMHPIERIGFEAHCNALRQELAEAERPINTARSLLYFDGAPVAGHTVDANFASRALAGYEDLIEKLAAVRRRGALHGSGPVPGADASRLHISNTVRGSFGFELEEVATADLFQPSELSGAVEDASKLIAAAGNNDDAFMEALPDAGVDRVKSALAAFLGTVAEANATVRVVSQMGQASLSKEAVSSAAERVSSTVVSTKKEEHVPGTFLGVLLGSGRFEHRRESGEVISGRSSNKVDWTSWNSFDGTSCVVAVEVETITRGVKVRQKYTLLSVQRAPLSPLKD